MILAALVGALGRFGGRMVNTALGWAGLLLFGRVPHSKQIIVSVMALGSLGWALALLGVLIPRVSAFLLTAVPIPEIVPTEWIRLAMITLAATLPILVGLGSLLLPARADRPRGKAIFPALLRGYPIAFLLAIVLIFLACIGLARKIRSLLKRWQEAHIGIVVRAGAYDQLVGDIKLALFQAGFDLAVADAPPVLALPARLLGVTAGSTVGWLVPERLSQLVGPTLEVLVYPSDIALSGTRAAVARGRAAIASRLAAAPVYLTTSAEAQVVEDRIRGLADDARPVRTPARVPRALEAIDDELAHLVVGYEEWETLYRLRLQVERDLLVGRMRAPAAGADLPHESGEHAADPGRPA
jgi:hypothetical protein